MGKKAKTGKGKERAQSRKLDKADLPPPPAPVHDEVSWRSIRGCWAGVAPFREDT